MRNERLNVAEQKTVGKEAPKSGSLLKAVSEFAEKGTLKMGGIGPELQAAGRKKDDADASARFRNMSPEQQDRDIEAFLKERYRKTPKTASKRGT